MMPNRVIKESIKRSPQIDSLTWFEETVFYRLIVTVDDYGCFDGRPILIKNELFPTRENVTRKSVEDAITKLVAVGLLYQYEVDGRPYLAFPTWDKHQRIRNKHRKYPAPPDDMNLSAIRGQTTAISQPESNPNPNTNPNTNPSNFCAEPETVSAPVFALPLNDGTEYLISEKQAAEWAELYPAVDILQDLRGMKGWLNANPTKRKTKSGILRFVTGWLSRTQNKGGNKQKTAQSGNIFADLAMEMDGVG